MESRVFDIRKTDGRSQSCAEYQLSKVDHKCNEIHNNKQDNKNNEPKSATAMYGSKGDGSNLVPLPHMLGWQDRIKNIVQKYNIQNELQAWRDNFT